MIGSNARTPPRDSDQHGPRPHRGRHVGAQPLTGERQVEGALGVLGEHVERCKHAQHPVQRRLVGLRSLGKLGGGHWAARQMIGEPELGGHVHGPGDVDAPNHPEESRRRRPLILGRLDTSRIRTDPTRRCRLIGASVHGLPPSFQAMAPAPHRH